MNIHFFILTSFPFGMAAAKRRMCYAKGLLAAGNHIDVAICHKIFYDNQESSGKEISAKGEYKGIAYNYICGKYKSKNKFIRALDYVFLDQIKGFGYALRNLKKGDIAYCYFYDNLFYCFILLAAKIKGAKIVREVCEHPSALGVPTLKKQIYRWLEYHLLFPFFDGFISISRELDKFVSKYKSKKAKSIIVPILVEDVESDFDFSSMKSPYAVPYIIHTGTMLEQKDSISKIISAFARYKKETNSDCKLVFTGPQANEKCQYIPLMEKLGIRNSIELLGMVSLEDIAILQHFAAMTIIYKSDNLQTRNCFPTKLGEMLICGVPVITTSVGDSNLYLKNGVSALIIKPDDENTLVKYINLLLTDIATARRIGNAGRYIAQKEFNPICQGKIISDMFHNL